MRKQRLILCAVLIAFLSFGCAARQAPAPEPALFQVSSIAAVLAGDYDGSLPLSTLLSHGDFGIGTFHALEGEMVILDGRVYQVKVDGTIDNPPLSTLSPFAAVVPFAAEKSAEVKAPADFTGLAEQALALCANPDVFFAVKAHGHFSKMKTRSVPAQKKPYPPLTDVTRYQREFPLEDVTGTIVGFYSPAFSKGISVPGFHLHFLSDDRKTGGHVLSFSLDQGEFSVMPLYMAEILFPEKPFSTEGDRGRDMAEELKKAEGDGK